MSTFQSYRRNVYSQNGEDGVIAEIIRRVGLEPSWTCDVGAWDGRYGSNFVIRSEDGELAKRTGEELSSKLREAGYEPVDGGL